METSNAERLAFTGIFEGIEEGGVGGGGFGCVFGTLGGGGTGDGRTGSTRGATIGLTGSSFSETEKQDITKNKIPYDRDHVGEEVYQF